MIVLRPFSYECYFFSSELPSVALNQRMSAENMVVVVEDLIKMLDLASNSLHRGRYPEHGKSLLKFYE